MEPERLGRRPRESLPVANRPVNQVVVGATVEYVPQPFVNFIMKGHLIKENLQFVLEHCDKLPDARFKKGMALEKLGRRSQALLEYRFVAERFPNSEAGRKAREKLSPR